MAGVALVGASFFLGLAVARPGTSSQVQGPARREFSVSGRKYAFEPSRLVANRDDIVKVTFQAIDIPHSFTIDAYRISKRANPGQPVTFEFHANQPGTFPIYCSLAIDERCKEMHGELVVREP